MFIPLKDENPTTRFPVVTVLFIVVNILVFFYQVLSPEGLQLYVYKLGAIPYEITHFQSISFVISESGAHLTRISPPLSLFTSMFLHGGVFHLFGNMLYLWIFGNNIEDYLGSFRFVIFYLIGGLAASLTHILFNPGSQVPMIGASGAIAGILGAYFILYPSARVLTLVFFSVIPVPAAIILGIWFVGQLLNIGLGGGVAWFAHIGGFVAGLLLLRLFKQKRRTVSVEYG
ncbi:MAG: rhomboid family intramembrane serine protease [Acidobacteria bacterium]|nr:rhomboid family intramembrane serine protease [Acidobacteriota bacterium]MBU4255338.1 rhomboid family intramembrane serine protease [Acidobacteriota bacterium]MBU4330596.1 rhomboid family intramembrane serine protease [Acidobacteriota bacterium]MBU4495810.1 rhomboid family intramembrane serine protease [Acidobacteriota bacterium]MCG2815491.1 rhomboid family intramembrane serine protease [Candidatus Aminicenantes bacterium]